MSITTQERVGCPFLVVFELLHAVLLLLAIFEANDNRFAFSQIRPVAHNGLPGRYREFRPLRGRGGS